MDKTTTQRGLGADHQALRRRLLPLAYGQACPYYGIDPKCPGKMLKGHALDLDHSIPRVMGGAGPCRIAHAGCNRRAGARLGNRLRRIRRQVRSRW